MTKRRDSKRERKGRDQLRKLARKQKLRAQMNAIYMGISGTYQGVYAS